MRVGHPTGIGSVGGRRVSGGGIGWRVGGVDVRRQRRLRVGGDGGSMITTTKANHGEIGQDGLCK